MTKSNNNVRLGGFLILAMSTRSLSQLAIGELTCPGAIDIKSERRSKFGAGNK
jgi:hypothetical protein